MYLPYNHSQLTPVQKWNEKAIVCLTYLADNQEDLSRQLINFTDTE